MAIDQTTIDLLSLIGRDTILKKAATTQGGEYHGACPFCGGKDRLRVQPYRRDGGRWVCRVCGAGGDAIAYVRQRDNLDFKAALAYLGLTGSPPTYRSRPVKRVEEPRRVNDQREGYIALTDPGWQQAADEFHLRSLNALHDPGGQLAMDYLLGRGLNPAVIAAHSLGYNPADTHQQWGEKRVFLPSGIVIPWHFEGQYWNIRIRRLNGESPKYLSPAGIANGLYVGYGQRSSAIATSSLVVMVEGEFDAMVIRAQAGPIFGARLRAVATGSASGGRTLRWVCLLAAAERVLLAFDDDLAGDEAGVWWQEALGERVVRWRPTRHDVTDMVLAGEDVASWLKEGFGL